MFLFERGSLRGPVGFSTIGMRIQNEQSGSSSLFAQPMALEPVVEETGTREQGLGNREQEAGSNKQELAAHAKIPRTMLEARMETVLEELEKDNGCAPAATVRQAHLALLKRWYYRPEVKREGEICFPDDEGHWPIRSMLAQRGARGGEGPGTCAAHVAEWLTKVRSDQNIEQGEDDSRDAGAGQAARLRECMRGGGTAREESAQSWASGGMPLGRECGSCESSG